MTFKVLKPFKVRTQAGLIELKEGQVVAIPQEKASRLVSEGKVKPAEPYITSWGTLVIPFDSDRKYNYWNGGQGVCDTLKELDRCDLIEKYKSIYSN